MTSNIGLDRVGAADTAPDADRRPRRRSIADRERAAQRFLIATVDERFDADLDIDWSAAPSETAAWLPEHLVSVSGTRLWERMPAAKRTELARRELVNLLTLCVFANTSQSMLEFRRIGEDQTLADDTARWGFATINVRTTNTAMFGRLITVTGLPPHPHPRLAWLLERYTLLIPAGAMTASIYLMAESCTRALVTTLAADRSVQPHVRQVAALHERSTRRLSDFARLDFEASMDRKGPLRTFFYSVVSGLVLRMVARTLIAPEAYRETGLMVRRSRWAARRSSRRGARLDLFFAEYLDLARAHGLFGDGLSRRLVRIVPAASRRPETLLPGSEDR
ncbi:diiron oxygenase [Williamsia sp. MIQD14]|uniref:diiron oxygenase n=1 Tax=Williamsia sp. MIQD14 TaxID=3425703 RepID=UPI003D9FCD00